MPSQITLREDEPVSLKTFSISSDGTVCAFLEGKNKVWLVTGTGEVEVEEEEEEIRVVEVVGVEGGGKWVWLLLLGTATGRTAFYALDATLLATHHFHTAPLLAITIRGG